MRSAAVVGIAVVLAFTLRVAPAYPTVFEPTGIKFLDNDSWFHMRSIHNLLAHYPRQSGFDPYALFPGGQVLYTEPWDLTVASVSWVMGIGKPSALLADEVGAWLPAILGAMLPILVYLLGKRLFGNLAGELSALTVAVIPGILLWETHLGVPDHHVAECLLSLIALLCLCDAVERQGRARVWLTVLAGLSLGVYLCVRPAGIFVPGTLAVAALLEPALVPPVAGAVAVATAVFFASSGNKWAQYTWLSLSGCLAICLLAWALGWLWRKRQWRKALLLPAAGMGALIAVGIVAVIKPVTFFALVETVRRFLPRGQNAAAVGTIIELHPLWIEAPRPVLLLRELGGGLLLALPSLLCAIPVAWRLNRPALTLATVWGLVMTIAGIMQLRMLVYAGPVLALAAGAGAAWLIGKMPRFRTLAALAVAAFVLATSLPAGIQQTRRKSFPDPGWRAALDWLSRNTPEPMGDPGAWLRFWPRPRPGETFHYPKSAYGVLTWWDYGDWINAISHRMPTSNGTQVDADKVAEFLTETDPVRARLQLSRLTTRYVVLNPVILANIWQVIELWAHRDDADYSRTVIASGPRGKALPIKVFLPGFYRSMAVRMFFFDGRRVSAGPGVSVFITHHYRAASGAQRDVLIGVRKFSSEKDASDFMIGAMAGNPGQDMTIGSSDPTVSCTDLEELPWARLAFASEKTLPPHPPLAVKIFEITP